MSILRLSCNHLPIPSNCIDMIFSDPPYVKDLLYTYQWLAVEAARVLKPGKFVAVMCGGNALNKIMRWFDDAGLEFYWLYQIGMSDKQSGNVVWKWVDGHQMPISTRTKHVLVYNKGEALARTATTGLYWAGGADNKEWHNWGQNIDSHRYYIDCFSTPGDLVLDPLAGGGTTAAACQLLGRRWICGDLDIKAIKAMQERLTSENTMSRYPLFTLLQS